jgi:hypothetical protein
MNLIEVGTIHQSSRGDAFLQCYKVYIVNLTCLVQWEENHNRYRDQTWKETRWLVRLVVKVMKQQLTKSQMQNPPANKDSSNKDKYFSFALCQH